VQQHFLSRVVLAILQLVIKYTPTLIALEYDNVNSNAASNMQAGEVHTKTITTLASTLCSKQHVGKETDSFLPLLVRRRRVNFIQEKDCSST
jgi:hypothetical protein